MSRKEKASLGLKALITKAHYELLTPYVTARAKVLVRCPNKHEYLVAPYNFKSGYRCPECSMKKVIGLHKQRSKDIGDEFLQLLNSEGYSTLSEYTSAKDFILLKCPNGHTYQIRPDCFKSKQSRCPICRGKCKETNKENFLTKIKSLNITLCEPFDGYMTRIDMRCPVGHKFQTSPYSIMKGTNCPVCAIKIRGLTRRDGSHLRFINALKNDNYRLTGTFVNTTTSVEVECNKGHSYRALPSSYFVGYRCPVCSGTCTVSAKANFIELIEACDYELLEDYVNTNTKVKLRCNLGHVYTTKPDNFKSGQRCGACAGKDKQVQQDSLVDLALELGYTIHSVYEDSATKVLIECDNKHHFNMLPINFKRGQRCPACAFYGFNPDKPSKFYIQSLSLGDALVGYKYGITNRSAKTRMEEQSKASIFAHKIIKELQFEDGYECFMLESKVNKVFKGMNAKFFREYMSDGFSETITPDQYDTLINLCNSVGKS